MIQSSHTEARAHTALLSFRQQARTWFCLCCFASSGASRISSFSLCFFVFKGNQFCALETENGDVSFLHSTMALRKLSFLSDFVPFPYISFFFYILNSILTISLQFARLFLFIFGTNLLVLCVRLAPLSLSFQSSLVVLSACSFHWQFRSVRLLCILGERTMCLPSPNPQPLHNYGRPWRCADQLTPRRVCVDRPLEAPHLYRFRAGGGMDGALPAVATAAFMKPSAWWGTALLWWSAL